MGSAARYNRIQIFFAAVLLLFLLGGCRSGDAGIFRYPVYSVPATLDPQLSDDLTAHIIIENCFEGLLTLDENGELVPGAAERYTVSGDGRIYTFYLREDLVWSDGETPVTADDFLFAFERTLSPETAAPSAAAYICIRGAESVLAGEAPVSSIGVVATGKQKITFLLEYPNPYFPYLLSEPAAMPCNRAFFAESKGKYGKTKNDLLYNGAFSLQTYRERQYWLLRPNKSYRGAEELSVVGVNLLYTDESVTGFSRMREGMADLAPLDYADFAAAERDGYTVTALEDTAWALVMNTRTETLSSLYFRKALAMAIEPAALEEGISGNFRRAGGIIPGGVSLFSENYRDLAGESVAFPLDTEAAKSYLSMASADWETREIDPTTRLTLLCPDDETFVLTAGKLQSDWQRNLSLFVNIERMEESALLARTVAGTFQLAILPFRPAHDSPAAAIGLFSSAENVTGYTDETVRRAYEQALREEDPAEAAALYRRAEAAVVESGAVVPLLYETGYTVTQKNVINLRIQPFSGRVRFDFAVRLETDLFGQPKSSVG